MMKLSDLLERKHLKCSSHLQDVGVVDGANGHSNFLVSKVLLFVN
jgi:hypothetical protein